MHKELKITLGILITIVLSAIVVVIGFILLMNQEDKYDSHNSDKFVSIQSDPADIVAFTEEIREYVHGFDENLLLGEMELLYDKDQLRAIFLTFGKGLEDGSASSINVSYDAKKQGIFNTEFCEGTTKVCADIEQEIHVSKWKIMINEAMTAVMTQLRQKGIREFDRIGASCFEDSIEYTIYLEPDDEYNKAIQISIPTG